MSGFTPLGPADNLHFIRARYLGQECGTGYEIQILPAIDPYVDPSPQMFLRFEFPGDVTTPQSGTFAVSATIEDYANLYATTTLTLRADRIDSPSATEPHIIGRFTSSDLNWSLDFRVDVVSQFITAGCGI